MSEWLKSLVGFMLFVSVMMQILPQKKYEQYVRLFTGFLMIILVLQPILKMGSADSYLENKIMEFVQEQEKLEEMIAEKGLEFRKESAGYESDVIKSVEIQNITRVEVIVGD